MDESRPGRSAGRCACFCDRHPPRSCGRIVGHGGLYAVKWIFERLALGQRLSCLQCVCFCQPECFGQSELICFAVLVCICLGLSLGKRKPFEQCQLLAFRECIAVQFRIALGLPFCQCQPVQFCQCVRQ